MASHSWIRRVFFPTPRTVRKPRGRVRPAPRLLMEALEARLAPAFYSSW